MNYNVNRYTGSKPAGNRVPVTRVEEPDKPEFILKALEALEGVMAEMHLKKDPQLRLVIHIYNEYRTKRRLTWLLRALQILEGRPKSECFNAVMGICDWYTLDI